MKCDLYRGIGDSNIGCWMCHDGAKGKAYHKGHYGYRPPPPIRLLTKGEYMKRTLPPENPSGEGTPPEDIKTWEKFPLLTEHLTHVKWDDGKPRTPSTLTISFNDGKMVCCLNDREANSGMFVTGATFQELLRSLEANLAGRGESRWVAWKRFKK